MARSVRRPRWQCLRDDPDDSRALPGRPDRPPDAASPPLLGRHFKPTEVLSSDNCRGLVSDDENDQARPTTRSRCCTSSPASGWPGPARQSSMPPTSSPKRASRWWHWPASTTSFRWRSCSTCRNGCATSETDRRPTATSGRTSSATRKAQLRRSLRGLGREGFRHVYILKTQRRSMPPSSSGSRSGTTGSEDHGPFDIIGDVHGCCDELGACFDQLGYTQRRRTRSFVTRQAGRRSSSATSWIAARASWTRCKMVMTMVAGGVCAMRARQSRHEADAQAQGRDVQIRHGLANPWPSLTLPSPPEFRVEVAGVPRRAREPLRSRRGASWSSPTPA